MIHLDNITKQYVDGTGTRKVLDGLSLYVEEGDFIAVTGESGSGKTTLLSILGTQLLVDSGKYMLGDIDVAEAKEQLSAIRNKKIGMVFQDSRLLPQFTAMQNILLPVLATEETVPKAAGEKAEELMGMMGISALKDKYVDCLSGGEKTRVAICRALLQEPLLLLADEPTGQLDDENANNIASLFRKVNAELGTTIVMVTHSPMIAKAANKRYNLKKGKLQEID
ncbi:MAG: ABC transporter ATP-binding protein [Bacteroidaceae bacterium]|nr:ABC transporter ATP-binding protein [Bacteroidaceae bacterium]